MKTIVTIAEKKKVLELLKLAISQNNLFSHFHLHSISPQRLKELGISVSELRRIGFDSYTLLHLGYSERDVFKTKARKTRKKKKAKAKRKKKKK